ncbi:5-methylcytosine-specific restriction endonuclease McrA [Pseudarthrobacter siccitolerans]|uniref:5-methylcytosine-specific restriction endonuclease McrA n=1 Tax=Pseudarthrobacter siccitolerans TaxID=861266 RepID=A0ABU0PHD7_9MICC|nr:HNH endonuclease [Pseudarthrobacter siccitolerans]MDQ0672977.1 5-methylcytosine-specific restriction endonuclease McrA [Pseudarthrobacter siccitolerans]
MKLSEIQRRETTKEERQAIRAEYNAWRRGDILINGWTWKRWRRWAYHNQRGKCYYCRKKKSQAGMQVDHRVAVFYGGPNHVSNFILACQPCNAYKAQHVLLRAKDNQAKQLVKAKVERPHRVDYAPQERAYAAAVHAVLDEQMMNAINRSD